MLSSIFLSYALFLCFSHPFCSARDTITKDNPIKDDGSQGLVSAGGKFELGFFPLHGRGSSGSYRRYVGIWYHNVTPRTVIWVANRDKPLLANHTGVIAISQGTLQVLDITSRKSLWLAEIEVIQSFNRTVKLKDDGNLVLSNALAAVLWQSFENPTDTFIPGMIMVKNLILTSWNDEDDPRTGNFTFEVDEDNQYIIKKSDADYWKSRAPNGNSFSSGEMPAAVAWLLSNFSKSSLSYNETEVLPRSGYNYTRLVIDFTGKLNLLVYTHNWSSTWREPSDYCSVFNRCGDFGICNSTNKPICRCLQGFKPQLPEDWNSGDFSGGCLRESNLCANRNDTFFSLKVKKAPNPDPQTYVVNETECRNICLKKCECLAYAYTTICFIWGVLSNLEESSSGHNLYARIARSDLDQISRAQLDSARQVKNLIDTSEFKEEDGKGIDIPFLDLQSILDATDNFSDANKLGQGGYGPVYKGEFPGGQEIAVKRLSRVSVQGLQEFKNEVVLIAKLQHRNLVRLKGYCMKGEEKILLYEYMSNKSLDFFIFDHTQSVFLNWDMRFNIILGIARGLLYLHQDSRLRIIHRDLKTSNILLDEEMNPKISDFGLARIVGGKETEGNTNTVVGTYGYMSPEYALDGTFSVKSDVFSFGVVLLEIISGKKNTGFYQSKQNFSLLGYAWRLWTENKALDLIDMNLHESCNKNQFLACVNVGLLCVQEDPNDRPAMSTVVTLLDSGTAIPPTPKQPAFVIKRGNSSTASTSSKQEAYPEITNTLEEGR
ncbi:putative protein kinase RLK-Pelle-DLSV family [Rosa chinensis]|uniref:Receptor-like serine/threonine-protein kinase n=1 Tax=Rosa chinensis TaxID=74649 RepID=A0A2P6S2Q9_ROSCH|nr:putative protein kinase RLK-Pelle-DLSV family [Rosa chinensis]